MVSTQSTLNQEWFQYLANALKVTEITPVEHDSLELSAVLRKLLMDDVQVRTRNLFEVAGRYQLPPLRLTEDYFQKVIARGVESHWGAHSLPSKDKPPVLAFSDRIAQYYFEEFVPSKFDEPLLKKAITPGTSIGFLLKGATSLGWVISAQNGSTLIERYDPTDERPKVCFHFTGRTMASLIQSKLPLHRALLLREVQVEGPLLQALRVSNVIEQFLREHPVDPAELTVLATEQTVNQT